MGLSLQGLSGELKGKVFPLRGGMTLGRKGDLEIPDPKASSIHARIDKMSDGTFAIIDNNSKNGILIDGEKLPSGALPPGTKLTIGEFAFLVIGSIDPPKTTLSKSEGPPPPPIPEFTPEVLRTKQAAAKTSRPEAPNIGAGEMIVPISPVLPPPAPATKYWYEVLASFIEKNQDQIVNSRKALTPLSPALVLEFQRGAQLNTKWTIGYGPRKIGARCMDLPIFEPDAPDVCFEVIPTPQGVIFKTNHPDKVLLNGKKVDNKMLHVGDNIRINETIIEVDFIE
jgi:hypothetical protein